MSMLYFQAIFLGRDRPWIPGYPELGQVQYCERLTFNNVAIMRILECIYECILAVSTSNFLYFRVFFLCFM